PGIRRRYRPNEDTILITRGLMPSASLSTPPKPFVLLVVADGMGGQGHGQEASQIAVQSLTEYVSGSLGAQQRLPEDFLPLLRASSLPTTSIPILCAIASIAVLAKRPPWK